MEQEGIAQEEPEPGPNWGRLPPEVWCLIFEDNIPKAKDRQNCLFASPQLWDGILHSQKINFLFPFVLPVISFEQRYLSSRDVLNLRLVSKSWKKYTDSYLKNHPCLLNLDGINHEKKDCCTPIHNDSSYCWQRATVGVQNSEQIYGLLEKLQLYPGCNPFLTQSLEFQDFVWDPAFAGDIAPELWNDFKALLLRIGPSIRHFRFLSAAQRTGPIFYKYIRELLELLPNLRSLRFWFVAGPGDLMVPQCEQLIVSNPLPNLEHLQVLKSIHLPTVIMNALLRKYSNQLEKLEILSLRGHSHLYSYEKDSINCSSNLKELSLRLWSLNDVWKLNSSGLLCSSLKSLNVFIDLSCNTESLEKLFYVLSTSKAGAILEKFSLEILVDTYGPVKKMVDPQTRLKLPSLKSLKINCKLRCLNTIDFILEMECLTKLVVHMEDIRIMDQPGSSVSGTSGKGVMPPEQLKFIGMEESLYESNIWQLLPKLNSIQVMDEVLEEEDCGNSFFDRDTSTHKRHFKYNRREWEELQPK